MAAPEFLCLDTPEKCASLCSNHSEKAVGLWATGFPRQNADVLWRLRQELMALGVPVVFFFRESAKSLVRKFLAEAPASPQGTEGIYQLENVYFMGLLDFVNVLVTSDYVLGFTNPRQVRAKLVSLPHNAVAATPSVLNYFFDYVVCDNNHIDNSFDYSLYPDQCKIHHNSSLSILSLSSPKLELLLEERQKHALSDSSPIIFFCPTVIDNVISLQGIDYDKYVEIWTSAITSCLSSRPGALIVFRPMPQDREHPALERIRAAFADESRFLVDDKDDNKYWIARARYFITDYSSADVNFAMTAKRPAVRMIYTREENAPKRDKLGWKICRPRQVVPCLDMSDMKEDGWRKTLTNSQESEMPGLGRVFPLFAGMIGQIHKGEDDPGWLRIDKERTPCKSPADLLKLVSKWTRKNDAPLSLQQFTLEQTSAFTGVRVPPQVWLLLLSHALRTPIDEMAGWCDSPAAVAGLVSTWLGNALDTSPFAQGVGVLRHAMRKYPRNASAVLLLAAVSTALTGPDKKRALFFYLAEAPHFDRQALGLVNKMAERSPQYFSGPVLDKLNRLLPLVMKFPLSLRRRAAILLGRKKPLAKEYWRAHRALGRTPAGKNIHARDD